MREADINDVDDSLNMAKDQVWELLDMDGLSEDKRSFLKDIEDCLDQALTHLTDYMAEE